MIGMAEGCTTNSGTTTLIQKSLGKCSRLYASLNRSTYQLNQGEMMVENAKRPEKGRSKNNLAERAGFEPALGYYPKHAFQACDLNHSSTSPRGAHCNRGAWFVKGTFVPRPVLSRG